MEAVADRPSFRCATLRLLNGNPVRQERMITDKDNGQHKWRMRMLFLHGAMVVAPPLLLLMHEHLHINSLGLCIFKRIFGIDCPACGITHSIMALFHGRIKEAFCIHPAGPVVFGVVGLMVVYLGSVLLAGYKEIEWRKEVRAYSILDGTVGGILLATWVGRLITN